MAVAPRVVLVTRPTQYELLLTHHATRGQAAFFLKQRGQSLDALEARHHEMLVALARIKSAIPLEWRRNLVLRDELDRFLFEKEDLVVVVGQDGLVANVAKYLAGQRVLGINPTPEQFDGVLVPHSPEEGVRRLVPAQQGELGTEARTMVRAELDDGQCLLALNELFIGHRTHQSARYELRLRAERARHSSSGVIVTTGTGGTGWARSINRERGEPLTLPRPTERRLAFFAREAFPSISTSVKLTQGAIGEADALMVTLRMEDGVIFGDGMEADHLCLAWGMTAQVSVAEQQLHLVL